MADNKKSFVAYADWKATFDELPDEYAGKLIKHIFAYVNDENPKSDDIVINAVFANIKNALKRDLEKWEKTISDRSLNGRVGNLKRYHIDLYEKYLNNELSLEKAETIAKSRKMSLPDSTASQSVANLAVNDNVSVSVSVNDNVNKNKRGIKKKFNPPSQIEVINYFVDNGYTEESAKKAFTYYETGNWIDGKGNHVINWKQKMQSVWFKPDNKKIDVVQKSNYSNPIL